VWRVNQQMTRDEAIDILAVEIRKRRDGSVLLLAVQTASAVNAVGLSQENVDEAFRRADLSEPLPAPAISA